MKRRFQIISISCILTLTVMLNGCGAAKGDNIGNPDNVEIADGTDLSIEPGNSGKSPASAAGFDITEPPIIELRSTADSDNAIVVRPSGYTWTYLGAEDQATSSIADSADPLAENAPWPILTLSDNDSEAEDYALSLAAEPDKILIEAWDSSDIGKNSRECQTTENCIYSKEEAAAADFTLSLRPGRVYEIGLIWEEENAVENGFYGNGYYIFITAAENSGEQAAAVSGAKKTRKGQLRPV